MAVNVKVVQAWVDALRSGEFPQGRSALRDNGKYCCLGVLCELAVREGIIESHPAYDGHVTMYGTPGKDCSTGILPRAVVRWAGVNVPDVSMNREGDVTSAIELNDRFGLTFNQIADVIEENFLKGAAVLET